jgi:hypothetical protein
MTALALALSSGAVAAAGRSITGSGEGTGEKPQSKLWYNDGTWWGILHLAGQGLHFYEFDGADWKPCGFAAAELGTGGAADVKWNSAELFVLAYSSSPQLFAYTYDKKLRAFDLVPGFPVSIPINGGSETMVLDQDSTGRLWATYEGNDGDIHACWSTSPDHRQWFAPGLVIASGVNPDDISSVVAFDHKVGIFWSDQNRWQFGFRVHRDEDPPTVWQPVEVVASGHGISDDHINVKADGLGNVYAVCKDLYNHMRLFRRDVRTGRWSIKTGVIPGTGTRGIVLVCDADQKLYVPYTNWSGSSLNIYLRSSSYSKLAFQTQSAPLINGATLNNVTGTKQVLPKGCFMTACEGGGHTWWNGWGTLPSEDGTQMPPNAPTNIAATLSSPQQANGPATSTIQVSWTSPDPARRLAYHVYRTFNSATQSRLTTSPVSPTSFVDANPAPGHLCYQVAAVDSLGRTSPLSFATCIDYLANQRQVQEPTSRPGTMEPLALELHAAPNPFNPQTALHLSLPEASWARIAIYDVAGRRIALLHEGTLAAGEHRFDWSAHGPGQTVLTSGVYFAVVEVPGKSVRDKLVLVR